MDPRNLYVYLGSDYVFCINWAQLLSSKKRLVDLPYFTLPYRPSSFELNHIMFTTISNKTYSLATTVKTLDTPNYFMYFEPEIREWKSLPGPPIYAALEYQGFLFVLSKEPYKLVVFELASFGESGHHVLDIWKDWRFNFNKLDIHWASLTLVGNDLISLVFISNYKIHISLIRFMKTFIYADLVDYRECDIPKFKKGSDVSLYSTFIQGTDIKCHEGEENPTISQYLTKADQIEDNSMDHNQDRYLYIYLGGFGALLSLNFNELCRNDLESKLDLQLVFSHHNRGAEYPIGMGLFARGSKLHFFGGENLEVSKDIMTYEDFRYADFRNFVGLNSDVRPKYFKYCYNNYPNFSNINTSFSTKLLEMREWSRKKLGLPDDWFNQKVFCFKIPFTSCDTPVPHHSGCKLRPLVFTISDKIYALSTKTVSCISVSNFEDYEGKLKLFEVFEPEKNEWRHIDKLPSELYKEILDNTLEIESHCVFRDQMLLQTSERDYVFDSVLGYWDESEMYYPQIYSALEYNNEVLLVVSRNPVELLVYELASFGKKYATYGKLDIVGKRIRFPLAFSVRGASLNFIDNNHVSLVIFTKQDIHVSVFKVEAPFRYAEVEAHRVFDAPKNCFWGIQPYSTFLLHDDTKAAGPREEKFNS